MRVHVTLTNAYLTLLSPRASTMTEACVLNSSLCGDVSVFVFCGARVQDVAHASVHSKRPTVPTYLSCSLLSPARCLHSVTTPNAGHPDVRQTVAGLD